MLGRLFFFNVFFCGLLKRGGLKKAGDVFLFLYYLFLKKNYKNNTFWGLWCAFFLETKSWVMYLKKNKNKNEGYFISIPFRRTESIREECVCVCVAHP